MLQPSLLFLTIKSPLAETIRMKKLILTIVVSFVMVQVASAKMTRLKHAHHHGSAKLGLAFDDGNGRLDFKVSADSIFGFEREPKNDREKKLVESQYALLENKISKMVVLAPELACQFTKEKISRDGDSDHDKSAAKKKAKAEHSEHSDVMAVFAIKCNKSPIGSKITFNIQKFFPKIQDVEAAVVAGNLQKSLKIKNNGATVDL